MIDDFLDDVLSEPTIDPVLLEATREKPEKPGLPLRPKARIPMRARTKRESALVMAERFLKPPQRFYARLLLECDSYVHAERMMTQAGYDHDRATLYRWRRQPAFVKAYKLMQAEHVESLVVNKDKILSDAEKAKEIALNPKPILYKGEATGHDEVNVGAYIRALELQGKAIGVGGDESQKVQVNIDIDYSGRVEGSADVIDGG